MDALLPANGAQSASGDLKRGPHVVEVPAQVVAQAGALRDEALAVVDEQANVELKRPLLLWRLKPGVLRTAFPTAARHPSRQSRS